MASTCFGQCRGRPDGVRVGDHAVLPPLHALDLANLRLYITRSEAAIDDADAAFFGDRDCHLGAGDRIHVGGYDRALQRQVFGETRRRDAIVAGFPALDDAVLRIGEQKVVERTAAYMSAEDRSRYVHYFPNSGL
jgi:hypothetical protein